MGTAASVEERKYCEKCGKPATCDYSSEIDVVDVIVVGVKIISLIAGVCG